MESVSDANTDGLNNGGGLSRGLSNDGSGNDRVAIFGSGGQLGAELVTDFTRRGYAVAAFTRGQVDITDGAQVEQCLAQVDPAVVINAAAYNQVDVSEKEPQPAYLIN